MLRIFRRRPPGNAAPHAAGADATDDASDEDPAHGGERGVRDAIRDDLVGGRHLLAYLRHLARGNALTRSHLSPADDQRPPVILIHGFLGTRGSMLIMERRLARDGVTVFSFDLGLFNTHDIRLSAVRIQRKIESILSQVSVDKIDIVGHSMGGLIGLYYIKRLGGAAKVRKLVMMGSPIEGTWTALAGVATVGLLSAGTWQILPGSRFLRELREGPLPPGVDVYTIAAERDWVCPPGATALPGARRMTVPLGHSSLVVSDEVYRCVKAALAVAPSARRP
jgi:pimeloyl-ACP methyl ester carboxylesterase